MGLTPEQFRALALSFDGTEENPHFDRAAFKVSGRRIFATMHEPSKTANLMLTPVDQSVFCDFGKGAVYPVPNKWGLKGATTFNLSSVPRGLLKDALETAYEQALKK